MIDETVIVRSFHEVYCAVTGLKVPLTMDRIFAWNNFRGHGYTQDDVKAVVALLRRKIQLKQRWSSALNFRNLIQNLSVFEEDLAEARACARTPQVDRGKAEVLRATGRDPSPPKNPVRTPEQILAADKAFEEFRKLKASL